jgi:hypothetical protein
VTTIDFDFLFRKRSCNVENPKAIAERLQATILRPFYPSSGLFRLVRGEDTLQIDFMTTIHGVTPSPACVPAASGPQASPVTKQFWIFWRRHSKKTWMKKRVSRKQKLDALKAESDRALIETIRRLLAKPPQERTHFLSKRIGFRATAL